MKIKKKEGDFNSYSIDDVSYGELVALEKAMATQHGDALSDEVYATIKWYLDELPKPGESKENDEDGDGEGPGMDDRDFDHAPSDDAPGSGPSDDAGEGDDDSPAPSPEPDAKPEPRDKGGDEGESGESADDYLEAPPE